MGHFNNNVIPRWIQIMLLVLTIGLFIIPALYNGYPLVYPDTGTYIESGHSGKVNIAIPLMYGLFVRHISMSASLWFVVIMQALITVCIIVLVARVFWKGEWPLKGLLLVLCIAAFTAASNFTSQIMPDFLTSLLILSFCIFLLHDGRSIWVSLIIGIFILFCDTAHLSNMLISPMILAVIIIAKLFVRKSFPAFRKIWWLTAVVVFSWIFVPTFNYLNGSGFNYTRTNNIRFMGRLVETGIISEYLNDNCGKKDIPLCKYRDRFPMPSDYFLWHNSPLYDDTLPTTSFDPIWIAKNAEYTPLINDILTTPKYLLKMAGISVIATIKQLGNVGVEKLEPMMEGSPVLGQMLWRYPNEANQYKTSRQAYATQTFPIPSLIQNISVIISLIGLFFILVFRRFRKKLLKGHILLLLITISGIIFNAWVCTTLSTSALRYQSRVSWLIPFVFVILVINLVTRRKEPQV